MKRFLTIMAMAFAFFCHGQQTFNFTSDGVQQQSAGVFDESGRLIRTLFTGKVFPSGTTNYSWDGKDELGNTVPQGKYSVKLLSHNLKAEWEGTIANSSKQSSNTTWGSSKRHNGYYGAAIDIYEHTNGWVYYTTGYSEGNATLRKLHLNSPNEAAYLKVNATTDYSERQGGPSLGLASCYNICSDGNYLYADGLTWGAQTVINGAYVMNNRIFIMKFDLSNDQMVPFSAGQSISPANYSYPNVVVLQQGLAYQASWPYVISGLAVDGNYLYAAQKDQNKISVFNKVTGSLVSSTTTLQMPRRMVSDGTNLWVIYGVNQISKFAVSSAGVINTTPLLTINGLGDPHSLSFQTVGGVSYVYVTDGGSNQVVRRYKTSDGSLDISFNGGKGYFGQLGGYTNSSIVTDDRFYFATNNGKLAGLHVRPDGGMWVCDDGNNRLMRYDQSLTKTHDVEWQGATYNLQMVVGDSTRLLSGLTEFSVDYTQPIQSSWKLTRQYEPTKGIDLDPQLYFNSLVKFPNGRTYGLVRTGPAFNNGTISGGTYFVLYELTSSGLRNTGIYKTGFGWSIQPDGSMIDCSVRPGSSTVLTQYALKGFDGSQNPIWSSTGTVIGKTQTVGTDGVNGGFVNPVTNDGKLLFFDGSAPNNGRSPYGVYNQGFHLGAIKYDPVNGATEQNWLWRGAYSTSIDYAGDYPADGKFDIGNGTVFPGGQARIMGDFITWNHHGEFWKGGQTNMHHLLYKNGLQLMQFGVAVANAQNVFPKGYPGMAGNALTTALIRIGDVLYLWHGDESYHSGIHRWKISGLSTVKEQVIPLYAVDKPEANFSSDRKTGCAPLAVNFTDASLAGTDKITGWLWTFGDGTTSTVQNPSHTYDKTGSYSVSLKVTTAAGVTSSYTGTDSIRAIATPTVAIVSDAAACVQSAVTFTGKTNLSGVANLSWEWDFGNGQKSTAASPAPQTYTTPGSYSVSLKIADPSGCTASTKTNISIQAAPALTVSPDVEINAGDVAQLTASGAERYTWNNGSTLSCTDCASPKATPKVTTVYTVTGTNSAGCRTEASVKVSVRTSDPVAPTPPPPTNSPVQASYSASKTAGCAPLAVNFTDASLAGTDKITGWLWTFGDGTTSTVQNPSHTYDKTGSYSVSLKVTTAAGVTSSYTGTSAIQAIGAPSISIVGDSVGCAQARASFQGQTDAAAGTGFSWTWDFGNGQTSTLPSPEPQLFTTPGNYQVSVSVKTADGCAAKATKTYAVRAVPTISAGPDVEVCKGSVKQLSATGGARYQWQTDATLSCLTCASPLAAPASNAKYVVTGTDSYGCSASDTVAVTVRQPFQLKVDQPADICIGGSARLSASGADQYSWSPAVSVAQPTAGVTTATPPSSMRYTVTGKDSYNCFTDTASVYVTVWPNPTVEAGDAQTLSAGTALQLTPTYSADVTRYKWTPAESLNCSTCPNPYASPSDETTYTVEASNNGGCKATASVTVHVICSGGNVLIPNTFSPNGDGRNDRFYVKGVGVSRIKSLKIYDRSGRLVFSRENMPANHESQGWDGTYNGAPLPSDVYMYTCTIVCSNNETLFYKGDVTLLR